MSELIEQDRALEILPRMPLQIIARYRLWFERLPAPWTAPQVRALTRKDGSVVRSDKTGRVVLQSYKGGKGGKAEKEWQRELHLAFQNHGLPWAYPEHHSIRIQVFVLHPRLSSFPKTKRTGWQPKVTKPDGTNILKAIEDAMTKAIFNDDSIIFDARCVKAYAPDGVRPGTLIIIDYLPRWNEADPPTRR